MRSSTSITARSSSMGSHAQLLAAKGAYYRLYESQYAMIRVASGAPEE